MHNAACRSSGCLCISSFPNIRSCFWEGNCQGVGNQTEGLAPPKLSIRVLSAVAGTGSISVSLCVSPA